MVTEARVWLDSVGIGHADQGPQGSPYLVVVGVAGKRDVDREIIPIHRAIEVGRKDSDVDGSWAVPDDPELSRRHICVTAGSKLFEVEDLGTTNGTFVDGVRVQSRRPAGPASVVFLGGILTCVPVG